MSSATPKKPAWPADRIVRKKVKTLVPYARNARTHSEAQVAEIVAAIEEWGWTNPIVVDEAGMIIAGHGRVLAAERLGLESVPAVVARGWSETQKRAYVLADNKLALNAGWDEDLLREELGELKALDFDLGLIGFGLPELRGLQIGDADVHGEPDAVPEPPTNPVTRAGDLWLLGEHRLLCGDSTSGDHVRRLMGGEQAALFSTDPPYLVDYTGKDRPQKGGGSAGKDWSSQYNEIAIGDAEPFFRAVFTNAIEVVALNAAWYCWHAHKRVALIERVWEDLDVLNHQQVIWVKPVLRQGHSFYPWKHEPCLMGWRRGHKPRHDGDNATVTSVWEIDWEGKRNVVGNEHPTQKPVEIFAIPMRKHTDPGDLCFEPFSGSGSQLIAGEATGRRVYAIELEPSFVDVAVERWEQFTGGKAVRHGTGGKGKRR